MLRALAIVWLGLLVCPLQAQVTLPEAFRTDLKRALAADSRSGSGQFAIREAPPAAWRPVELSDATRSNFVKLDPALLVVMCERIKRGVLEELRASDRWQGRIGVWLHRAQNLNEQITIAAVPSNREWAYYVDMPDTIEQQRMVSAIVNVVLLEMANRGASRSGEIPAWLGQGLTQELMFSTPVPIVLEGARLPGSYAGYMELKGLRRDPLSRAHDELQNVPPLTLEELSWPRSGQEEEEAFRSSAQLFVHELLQLDKGRRSLGIMIQALPRHLNWQFAFLEAFHSDFSSQLELEKWWALRIANFTGRDLSRTWSTNTSWSKLDEILRTTVQVRAASHELPLPGEVPLQTIIREGTMAQQQAILKDKLQRLFVFRSWVSQNLVALVDDYRRTLDDYLKKRDKAGFTRESKIQIIPGVDGTAQEAIRQLATLDEQRERLRLYPETGRQTTTATSASR